MATEYFDIYLTPEDRFFFGGETSFSSASNDQEKKDQERRSSYLIHSRILPQQTSLLGMLRYELLREAELLAPYKTGGTRKGEATTLVAATGFVVGEKSNGYGAVKALSPLRLHDGQMYWDVVPLDDGKEGNKAFAWQRVGVRYWKLKNYNPKKSLVLRFAKVDGDAREPSSLFSGHAIVGNRITNRFSRNDEDGGQADEEGLFRQTFRHSVTGEYQAALHTGYSKRKDAAKEEGIALQEPKVPAPSNFSFVFRVAIDTSVTGADAGAMKAIGARTVTLGGEQGTFRIKIIPVPTKHKTDGPDPLAEFLVTPNYKLNTGLEKKKLDQKKYGRIVFQSDVYLPKAIMEKYPNAFLLANTLPFRCLSTNLGDATTLTSLQREKPVKDKRYGRRKEDKLMTLLERGGVIIAPKTEVDSIITDITSQQPFFTIGYNYCTNV